MFVLLAVQSPYSGLLGTNLIELGIQAEMKSSEFTGSLTRSGVKRPEEFIIDEKADAIRSVVSNRNAVSHGGTCNATIGDLSTWFEEVKQVITFCHDLVLGEVETKNQF